MNTILKIIQKKNFHIKYNHTWQGWTDENQLVFNSHQNISTDYTVFALGGGSWNVTGSDGSWMNYFQNKGIQTQPFQASNCAFQVNWKNEFISKYEGSPLKNIAITCMKNHKKGEVVITKFGLEGNAIYALSPQIRSELNKKKSASIFIDLKPTLSQTAILKKIEASNLKNTSSILRKELKLSAVQILSLIHISEPTRPY